MVMLKRRGKNVGPAAAGAQLVLPGIAPRYCDPAQVAIGNRFWGLAFSGPDFCLAGRRPIVLTRPGANPRDRLENRLTAVVPVKKSCRSGSQPKPVREGTSILATVPRKRGKAQSDRSASTANFGARQVITGVRTFRNLLWCQTRAERNPGPVFETLQTTPRASSASIGAGNSVLLETSFRGTLASQPSFAY